MHSPSRRPASDIQTRHASPTATQHAAWHTQHTFWMALTDLYSCFLATQMTHAYRPARAEAAPLSNVYTGLMVGPCSPRRPSSCGVGGATRVHCAGLRQHRWPAAAERHACDVALRARQLCAAAAACCRALSTVLRAPTCISSVATCSGLSPRMLAITACSGGDGGGDGGTRSTGVSAASSSTCHARMSSHRFAREQSCSAASRSNEQQLERSISSISKRQQTDNKSGAAAD